MRRVRRDRRDDRRRLSAAAGTAGPPDDRMDEQELQTLLESVRELRLTLTTDLAAAAGAAQAGAREVAGDIVEGDRRELSRFLRLVDERMLRLAPPARRPVAHARRWRRRVVMSLPAVPLAGVLAVSAAAATGALPLPGDAHARAVATPAVVAPARPSVVDAPAASSFERFVRVVDGDPSAAQLLRAASSLHRHIAHLLALAPGDPAQAERIAQLLRMEQSLLLRTQPPGVEEVLDQSRRLAARLVSLAPELTPESPAVTLPQPVATPSDDRHRKEPESPEPKPSSASPSPSASSGASRQSTSTSPSKTTSPSPSPTGNPFPALPHS